MTRKDAPCSHCGTVYSLRRLRCPKCHLEREGRRARVTLLDRTTGLVLLGVGGLMGFGFGWFIYKSGFGRHALILALPLWLMLQGSLLLAGIHLRDFHAWWNRLSQPASIAIHLVGLAAFTALVWFLVAAGR